MLGNTGNSAGNNLFKRRKEKRWWGTDALCKLRKQNLFYGVFSFCLEKSEEVSNFA